MESVPRILLTADGSQTLYSDTYYQSYQSIYGALCQARWVFLEAGGVSRRLHARQPTRVLEIGFGTGLNAMLTLDLALATGCPLDFVSLERDLLPAQTFRALGHGRWLEHPEVAESLGKAIEQRRSGVQFAPQITFELALGDATTIDLPRTAFDVIYLDAFSPDANPELWAADFLARLHAALVRGGVLATYSVKGTVRRALESVGFDVAKRPGPPGKAEITVARR